MKQTVILILSFFASICALAQEAHNFKHYKLDNGLTVILDRDSSQTQVFGMVAANVGSKDEEPNATGLAHYLEHMLFKGTQTLGTSDWEKEKPLIDKIYALYDKLQVAKTDEEIAAINKEINDVSQEASQYAIPNEFTKLVEQMGGVGLNASTSYDVTEYHNSFPPNQLEKWIDLYAHRFQKPVFRLFQTELEAVYEEKNRAEDNPYNAYRNALLRSSFGGHPYGRPIIGRTEHLKKPWMSKMREFFEKWYVPENMVLVLSGNFDLLKAEKLILEKFGKWDVKHVAKRNTVKLKPFSSKLKVKVKLSPIMRAEMVYKVSNEKKEDELALDIASELLSNSSQTGLLDKLNLDGDVLFANAGNQSFKDGGLFTISFAPVFDVNQRKQVSFSDTESLIETELNKLKQGKYGDLLLNQVKSNMLKSYKLMMEHPQGRAFSLMQMYIHNKEPKTLFDYPQELSKMTKSQISMIVNKYINKNYLAFYSSEGKGEKEKIEKPKIDPIKPRKHEPSVYAKAFKTIPSTKIERKFVSINDDLQAANFADKIVLYHVTNKRNDVFSMNIVFHVGTKKRPILKYAVKLIQNAGVLSQYTPKELRAEFGKIGLSYNFSVNGDYTILNMQGNESVLAEACKLMSKLILMPKIEDKALNRIMGMEYQNRMIGKDMQSQQFAALKEYIKYGDKSGYIDRISMKDLMSISPSNLAGKLNEAFSCSADIHYYGKLPIEKVKQILKDNLALAFNRIQGTSPVKKETKKYDENTIFLLNNRNASQSKIFVFVKGQPINKNKIPAAQAFNQYFGGGFNGLMMKEIREYRSLAYTAGAYISLPPITKWNSNFYGSIGTQADKTVEAIDVLTNLLTDMPQHKDRLENIKDYMINSSYMNRPNDRDLSYNVYLWLLKGYRKDPVQHNLPLYNILSFDHILSVYNEQIKGKNYVIGIVGPTKKIDVKALSKYGKVVKVNTNKIFSDEK